MTPPPNTARYKNHRFPGEIISHGVWLYYRFPLSYRDVQELLFERGIDVTQTCLIISFRDAQVKPMRISCHQFHGKMRARAPSKPCLIATFLIRFPGWVTLS